MPSRSTGSAISTSTASSEPTKAPALTASSALTPASSSGWAANGTAASSTAAPSATAQSGSMRGRPSAARAPRGCLEARPPSGAGPAQPVADRECDEHHADRVGPYHRGCPEVRCKQAYDGDLDDERRHSDEEYEHAEKHEVDVAMPLEQAILTQRTQKAFRPDPVLRETLNELFE